MAHVERDGLGAGAPGDLREDRAGYLVARGELVDEPLAIVIEQLGPLAADRLRHEQSVAAAARDDRRRVELHELDVRERRAGRVGQQQPGADRARRVGRARPHRRGPAGAEHGRRRLQQLAAVEQDAGAASVVREQRLHAPALEHLDPFLGCRKGGELANDPPPGRGAAGVDDAAVAVATLEPEREPAVAVGVEGHPAARQVLNGPRRLLDEYARRRWPHGATARPQRVLEMQLDAVIGSHRGRQPALRPVARGLRQLGRGDERDVGAVAGGAERGVKAGGTGADYHQLPLAVAGQSGHAPVPYRDMPPRPVFLSHRSSLDHDTGDQPESARRIEAIDALLAREEWLGYECVASPAVERSVLERVHPAAYVDAIAAAAQRGGAQLDFDTLVSPGSYTAALHACGGAVELVRRLVDGGAGTVGFSAHRPPGHHALPSRAMGFCLFSNVAVAARHALAALGLDRVMILDWDVHHGNGTNDIFWESDQVLFVSIHQWPLYPGTGPASELGGGPGHGYTVNLPVPPRFR